VEMVSNCTDSDCVVGVERFGLVIVGAGKSCVLLFCGCVVDADVDIGADADGWTGIHGLAALKTYRHVHPDEAVMVLEKDDEIGGVWARDRLYPGLHTNNHFQTWVESLFVLGLC
jgi:hypothetical protein